MGATDSSLAFARDLGFEHAWREDSVPDLPYDAVVDASNAAHLPDLALELVEPAGHVVYIGLAGVPSRIDTRTLVLKDVTAVGVLSASPGLEPPSGRTPRVRSTRGRSSPRRWGWTTSEPSSRVNARRARVQDQVPCGPAPGLSGCRDGSGGGDAVDDVTEEAGRGAAVADTVVEGQRQVDDLAHLHPSVHRPGRSTRRPILSMAVWGWLSSGVAPSTPSTP